MWGGGDGKIGAKPRSGAEDYATEFIPLTPPCKDWSIGIARVIASLVIFMAGLAIGLSLSVTVTRYSSTTSSSHSELFFPPGSAAVGVGDCLGFKGFLHPAQTSHTMTDAELFWRASLVPEIDEFPFQRVPKVAFMFLSRGPLPFAPLWDRFFRGHEGLYSVYVHSPPNYKLYISKNSVFYGRQIPSTEVSWGSITLVDAEKRLLANALLDYSNERFILLSESCIPVFNFPTVYEYLINSEQSYVQSYLNDTSECAGRYNRRMAPQIQRHQWRKGSEWFELSRDLAVDILADVKYYDIFHKFCKPSCYPDEHYIPTYLHILHGSRNTNRSLTWVDWSRGGPHPARYGAESITPEFIGAIRNNGTLCTYNGKPTSMCYLFARKFAPSALGPLLNLTATVMEF